MVPHRRPRRHRRGRVSRVRRRVFVVRRVAVAVIDTILQFPPLPPPRRPTAVATAPCDGLRIGIVPVVGVVGDRGYYSVEVFS